MHIRARVAAVVVAVLALLAPASIADAATPYTLTVDAYATAVFPVVDGFMDTTEIVGAVDAGGVTERIRGAVVVVMGGRVVKSFPLTTAGPFHLVWDGRSGDGSIRSGTATVSVRVDGQTSAGDTLVISPKKVVKVTKVTTQPAWLTGFCTDDKVITDSQAWFAYQEKICHMPRTPAGAILRLTLRGSVSSGPIVFASNADKTIPEITNGIHPAVISITAKFQSGSGVNRFYLCEDSDCTPPTDATLQTFSTSGTYTSTGYSPSPDYPMWRIIVAKGHDLSLTKFTIKTTYWVLR